MYTSTVIVALPAKDSPVHEFGAEQKHATLVFLGEITDPTAAHEAARAVAEGNEPFASEVKSYGPLGSGNPPAQVLFLGKDELKKIHDQLLDHAGLRAQHDAIEQYPEYTPHVTIGYPGEGEDSDEETMDDEPEEAYANVPEVVFDRIGVWHQGEKTEYPMSPDKLVGLVAGYRYVRTQQGAKRFGVPVGSRIQVDSQGRVVRLDSGTKSGATRPVVAPSAMKVDPNRTPTKFVATVPGQKAKLPALPAISAPAAPRSSRRAGSTGTKNANPSLKPSVRNTLTNVTELSKYTKLTHSQGSAINKLIRNDALTSKDRLVLRQMIVDALKSIVGTGNKTKTAAANKKSSSGSKAQTSAQKQATAKAQKASSTSTSSAKKAAQAKSQKAASQASAFERSLRAAYKALGGSPGSLPQHKTSTTTTGTSSKTKAGSTVLKSAPSAAHTRGYMHSTVAAKQNTEAEKLTGKSLTSLSNKDLGKVIRSLAISEQSNPSAQVKSALKRARDVRRQRELQHRLETVKRPHGLVVR